MNRQQKEHVIESLKQDLSKSKASFVVGYQGLTVAELVDLRRKLQKQGGKFQVAKVTLMRRALAGDQDAALLEPFLADQIALVFAQNEPPVVAKVLNEFAKNHAKLNLLAGCFEHKVLSPEVIKTLASLPSREVLLSRLCGTLKAPVAKLAFLLKKAAESDAQPVKTEEKQ